MPHIYYLPDNKGIHVDTGEITLQAVLRAGIPHAHACGGKGRCSTCRVLILEGLDNCTPRNAKEQAMAERLHLDPMMRLACQTTVTGNVKMRRLVLDDEDVKLTNQLTAETTLSYAGKEKRVAILFTDIRGFTTFSEALPPYDVIHVMNRYFFRIGQVITRHGGYIQSYQGDGVMALFGIKDSTGVALRAVKAGIEIIEAVERLNPYLKAMYKTSLQTVIGVHYGEAVVGTVGITNMRQVVALGDAVNVASRIVDVNKKMGSKFLISEDTYIQVNEHVRVDRCVQVNLRGKSGKHTLYAVTGMK